MRRHRSTPPIVHARVLTVLLVASILIVLPLVPQISEAAGEVIAQLNISNTVGHSEAPQIDINSSGRIGIIWGERSSDSLGYSTSTVGAPFGTATTLPTGSRTKQQWPDIVVDKNGTTHIAYSVGDAVFYRTRPVNGDWSAAIQVATSAFPNPVRMALAPNGTIWIVWRDTEGSALFFRYSDNSGATWSGGAVGGVVFQEAGNMFTPNLAIDQNNNPHVVWYLLSSSAYKGQIRVADWDGSKFTVSSITNDPLYDADPAITVDSQNVQHVVWRKQLDDTGQSWTITYASRAPGKSWDNFTPLYTTSGDAKYAPAITADTGGSIYVTFSNPTGGTRRIELIAKLAGQNWDKPQSLSNGRWDSFSSVAGSTISGTEAHVVYEHEVGTDDGEIFYVRVRFGPTVAPVQALPQIEAGQQVTNKSSVAVSFTSVQGNPTQVRWRWGAAPTDQVSDSNGWQNFNATMNIAVPPDLASACQALTLYTQVRSSENVETTAKSATITYDHAVQTRLYASNPHMYGLPSTYSPATTIQEFLQQGASDGAPGYTRNRLFFMGIYDDGDCTGLKGYSVTGSTSGLITDNHFESALPLPGDGSTGVKTFTIVISDTLGNTLSNPTTIIFDPLSTGEANTGGAPVLNGGSVSVDNRTKSIFRTLSFTGVNVTDNLYGQRENLQAGSQFWGLWIANSATPVDPNTMTSNLHWYPVRVSNPGPAFSVDWNIFNGLNYGLNVNKAGTYNVYVKFLDGAGNPTAGVISTTVTLDAGYSFPSIGLPLLRK